MDVAGTPMDFKKPTVIGSRIEEDFNQLKFGSGYDHNYVVNSDGSLHPIAMVREPTTGRIMKVLTTEPAVQLYVGNFLDGSLSGKKGIPYNRRDGFCLETQHYPDSPNKSAFPPITLNPGEEYKQTTIYKFETEE
jgi:aldose 1-epimerase